MQRQLGSQDAAYARPPRGSIRSSSAGTTSLDSAAGRPGLQRTADAYKNARPTSTAHKNDAYNQAIFSSHRPGEDSAADSCSSRRSAGRFHNQAAGQEYQQNLGQAAFNNQTAGQDFGQNLTPAQFANRPSSRASASGAGPGASSATRPASRACRSGLPPEPADQPADRPLRLGQVSMPNGIQYTPSQVGQTDVTGAYALHAGPERRLPGAGAAKAA
jgi:hypothetical protein